MQKCHFSRWGLAVSIAPIPSSASGRSHAQLGQSGVPELPFPGSREGTFPGAPGSPLAEPPVPGEGLCCQRDRGGGAVEPQSPGQRGWGCQSSLGSPLWIPSSDTNQGSGSFAVGSSDFLPFPFCLCLLCPCCGYWQCGWLWVWKMLGDG